VVVKRIGMHQLTRRLGLEAAYRKVREVRGTSPVLYRPQDRVHDVRVYRITGQEVCPEMGLSGMDCNREGEGNYP
jgi:hypothetical protein